MTTATEAPRNSISRAEWLWLGGALLFGMIIRLSFLGRVAVEHFDEGVYASNFWFGADEGYEYPARHLYAPPLLPMAIEWTMIVASLCGIKPTGFIPMIPSLMAGLATIPSMWWIGRRWFGPTAGLVAAWFVAASDFHASYSRAALTDVPVCLFILWGVYFTWLALQSGIRRDVLLAGLFTGLAWWTKYNGWLPLAVGLAGGLAWQLALPKPERRLREFGTRWLMIAITAFAIWSPVLWGLQKHGGYAAVAANHRGYVNNFAAWPTNAVRQLQSAGRYDNWLGVFVEVFATIRNRTAVDPDSVEHFTFITEVEDARWVSSENLTIAALWTATPLLLFVATIAAGIRCVCLNLLSPRGLATWMLGAWLIGLSLTIPFYHPYPRLALPWLVTIWLGAGLAIQCWRERTGSCDQSSRQSIWPPGKVVLVTVVWLLTCTAARSLAGSAFAWQDRSDLQTYSAYFAELIKTKLRDAGHPDAEALVYVYGDPAMVFGLRANGLALVGPTQDFTVPLVQSQLPTFLVWRGYLFRHDSAQKLDKLAREGKLEILVPRVLFVSHLSTFDEDEPEYGKANLCHPQILLLQPK